MKHPDETDQEYLDRTYNGWEGRGDKNTAYATWRVNLELVADMAVEISEVFTEKPDAADLADYIKDWVEQLVCEDDPDAEEVVTQYALAFLDDVNYWEIAEHILLDWSE